MGKNVAYTKAKDVKQGTVMVDLLKRQWIVGQKLGEGGFGAIYTVQEPNSSYVMKIEPKTNGPIFTETNFYKRVCKDENVASWVNARRLKFLGIPRYISDGLNESLDTRFLIMTKYGTDLHQMMMKNNVSHRSLFQVTINILDVLEYMHTKDYSHADIKALNILQGLGKESDKVFLLDFGMVSKFTFEGEHKPEKADNKLKHNGTLEFCPRDSHRGLISCRRSDVESLMLNLIFWLTWDKNNDDISERVGCGRLPWLSIIKGLGTKPANVAICNKVAECKEKYLANPKLLIESVGLNNYSWSSLLTTLLTTVMKLQYTESPKYDDMRLQLATIICDIDQRSAPSANDLDKLRSIDWSVSQVNKSKNRRKSHMSTQITPPDSPVATTRKRPTSETETDLFLPEQKPTKKQRKQPTKKVLADNNTATNKRKPGRPPKNWLRGGAGSKMEDEKNTEISSIASRIPKGAFIKPPPSATIDHHHSPTKENMAPPPQSHQLQTLTMPLNPTNSFQPSNNVVPGMKTLEQLRMRPPTRSSPRLASKHQSSSSFRDVELDMRSVSCQTSPVYFTLRF